MAKRPLKVFRTAIGFHDAYVAATSRKAALEAWGADKDLFSSGAAEVVTDAGDGKAALAQPGVVIRVPRGTVAQHIAAAGNSSSPSIQKKSALRKNGAASATARTPRRKPSRTRLDRAEAALSRTREEFARRLEEVERKIEVLRREREALRNRMEEEVQTMEQRRRNEERAYQDALMAWEV
ncbi:hypothetical protein AB3M93_19695 [Novosphingobium panipatense]|uniref:hypothetical protein n=1 Tax=Novosphingobium TaxID=165696 RepID=UPI000CDB4C7C|nr:hypothetical protein [Novosphingobium sp. HII-3]